MPSLLTHTAKGFFFLLVFNKFIPEKKNPMQEDNMQLIKWVKKIKSHISVYPVKYTFLYLKTGPKKQLLSRLFIFFDKF